MNNFRIRVFKKLSQTIPTTQQTTVSGSPRIFNALDYYPSMQIGLQAKNIPYISSLVNLLNNAIYYSSNGKHDLSWLKDQNFNVGSDQFSDNLKNIINFSKQVNYQLFTNLGQNYTVPLNAEQILNKTNILKNNQSLNNLPTTNPIGPLSTKIGGNLKTLIINTLLQIK